MRVADKILTIWFGNRILNQIACIGYHLNAKQASKSILKILYWYSFKIEDTYIFTAGWLERN